MQKRRGSMRALAAEVPRIAGTVLGKRGFAEAQLIAEWGAVIGAELAEKVAPEKLSFPRGDRRDGTLRLRIASGLGPEIQHREPVLLERINAFFGYRAVARLTLIQGLPPGRRRVDTKLPRPLATSECDSLDRRLQGIEDPALRDALRRLGAAVIGSSKA